MVIKSLRMKEGNRASNDSFDNLTLITSSANSAGKTTFLRFLLHSLGYRVPAMKDVDYSKIETTLVIEESKNIFTIRREGMSFLYVSKNDENEIPFILPGEHISFLSFIFGKINTTLLSNLLGVIYIDQEKGWSLVNRGTVIGRNRFDVEDFIAGICDVDVSALIADKEVLERENDNLEAMLDIQSIKNELSDSMGVSEMLIDQTKDLYLRLNLLSTKIREKTKLINQLENSIKSETKFFEYIDSLALEVVVPDGNYVTLTKNNIKWKEQITPYLKTQLILAQQDLKVLEKERYEINATINQKHVESGLLQEDSIGQLSAVELYRINIDSETCSQKIKENRKQIAEINKKIKQKLESNVSEINKISKLVKDFSKDLSVEDKIEKDPLFIFTKDIKSYSGAILKKLSLAFKMAFHKRLEKIMNTKLPFIVDSPFGKELDERNIDKIHSFLVNQLKNNQLIVASIIDFSGYSKKITIVEKAIEPRGDGK